MSRTRSRRETRLAAVKALYAKDIDTQSRKSIHAFMLDMIAYYEEYKHEIGEGLDRAFFKQTLEGMLENQDIIDQKIQARLSANWSYNRLSPIIRATLRLAVYELMAAHQTPHKVIIDEYTSIAGHYFDTQDVAFVNSILDHIAHDVRHLPDAPDA